MGHIMIFSSRTFSLVTSQDILSVGLFVYDPQKRKSNQLKDFRHFFYQKTLPGLHINRQKWFREIVRFRIDIREERVSA